MRGFSNFSEHLNYSLKIYRSLATCGFLPSLLWSKITRPAPELKSDALCNGPYKKIQKKSQNLHRA